MFDPARAPVLHAVEVDGVDVEPVRSVFRADLQPVIAELVAGGLGDPVVVDPRLDLSAGASRQPGAVG